MKKKFTVFAVAAAITASAQTNLVTNGNLESWATVAVPTNWTIQGIVRYNTTAAEGQYSAWLSLPFASNPPALKTTVTLKPGVAYTVSFKYKYLSGNYSGNHAIGLQLSRTGDYGKAVSYFATNNNWNTDGFVGFTPITGGVYDLSISTYSIDGAPFDVLIDDVKVYDPASLATSEAFIEDFHITNPVGNTLKYNSPQPVKEIKIYNVEGRFVKSITENNTEMTALPKGIYLAKIFFSNNKIISKKIIKN